MGFTSAKLNLHFFLSVNKNVTKYLSYLASVLISEEKEKALREFKERRQRVKRRQLHDRQKKMKELGRAGLDQFVHDDAGSCIYFLHVLTCHNVNLDLHDKCETTFLFIQWSPDNSDKKYAKNLCELTEHGSYQSR